MTKREVLKEMGFSEKYLKHLKDVDDIDPSVEAPKYSNEIPFFKSQDTGHMRIKSSNNCFNSRIIISNE